MSKKKEEDWSGGGFTPAEDWAGAGFKPDPAQQPGPEQAAAAPPLKPSTDLANAPPTPHHDPNAQAAFDRATSGGLVNNLMGAIPEALTHLGNQALKATAGMAGGAAGVGRWAREGGEFNTQAEEGAGITANAVPTYTPGTAGGKALSAVADWALGQVGRGIRGAGNIAADTIEGTANLARHAGHPDLANAVGAAAAPIGAGAEAAASYLAPAGIVKGLNLPFKWGKKPLSGADAAREAQFTGDIPPQAGPPLGGKPEPTLNMANASVDPRAPGDLGIDMGGRVEPGINLGAAPDNLGNPLGTPSAAAQAPLPDTRPSLSILDRIIKNATEKTLAKAKPLTVLDESHAELLKEGYVFPPSHLNPSFVRNKLESVAGKAALDQQATILNQANTDRLAGKAARIPEGTPITMESLKDARYVIEEPYRRVAGLSPTAASALEDLKSTREASRDAWAHYNRQAVSESKTKAKALDAEADVLESMIDEEATRLGQPGLLQELRDARKASAQNRDIQRAYNPATGEVDARTLGRMWAKDKGQKMTGEGAIIGKFANTAKKLARPGADVPTPGVGKTEAFASAALGLGGHAAGMGMWPAGMVLAGGPTRALLLSRHFQKAKQGPGPYAPGVTVKLAELGRDADPLSLGMAGVANQENFNVNDPLGLGQ